MARKRAVRVRASDAVRVEPSPPLVSAQRDRRAARESAVDCACTEPVPAEPELEHRNVPSHRTDAQLTLALDRLASAPV